MNATVRASAEVCVLSLLSHTCVLDMSGQDAVTRNEGHGD